MHLMKDFGFLYEDMEVINATSSGNNILFKKCVTPLKVEFEEQINRLYHRSTFSSKVRQANRRHKVYL